MKLLHLLILVSIITACGGGGGGGSSDSNYAGNIVIDLERDHIDSGDINRISLEAVDINPKGSLLKIRLSKSLLYVKGSAVLFPNREEERPTSPDDRVATDEERFLVFFLYPSDAIGGDFVSLSFDVKGITGDKSGFIEVDLDNNDPSIADSLEFDPSAPRFTAKERRSIYIDSDTSEPTPTPTPSGTQTPGIGG
jgi:hypothetical protein